MLIPPARVPMRTSFFFWYFSGSKVHMPAGWRPMKRTSTVVMPDTPFRRFCRNSASVLPFGEVSPMPVMTMRLCFMRNFGGEQICLAIGNSKAITVSTMKVLVAGGAGYIGSHCVRQLTAAGHEPVVLDNLAYGHAASVPAGVRFVNANLGDAAALDRLFTETKFDLVMHFAAFCYVGESVKTPMKYYINNCSATYTLLDTMMRHGVMKFVFSSTCATFG